MRIAVVTAYCGESQKILNRCMESVSRQTIECSHIVVGDGDDRLAGEHNNVQHIALQHRHNDYGDTPRLVGSASAFAQGFDCLLWLDADNWFESDHVARMVELMERERVDVVTSARMLRRPSGESLGVCYQCDGVRFTDTSCYMLSRSAMSVACAWGFQRVDGKLSVFGDRYVWREVLKRFPRRAHNSMPSVNYTTSFALHYLERGETPPAEAKHFVKSADGHQTLVRCWQEQE